MNKFIILNGATNFSSTVFQKYLVLLVALLVALLLVNILVALLEFFCGNLMKCLKNY